MKDLTEAYLEAAAERNRASTIALDRQRIETYILPKFGRHHFGTVTRAQIRELVSDIGKRGRAVTANRVASTMVKLYRFANEQLDMNIPNPATGLQSTFEETSRSRVLSDSEFQKLWLAIQGPVFTPLTEPMALCLQLCVLTLQRGKEVSGIHMSEIDLDQRIWTLPASRSKNGRDHLVPLSRQACDVIQRALSLAPNESAVTGARRGPLFASPRDPTAPITRHALTRAMSRLCKEIKLVDASPHDLRRTGATNMTGERIGVSRLIVSAVLNHVSEMGGITRVYDRNDYLSEKRKALDAWGDLVMRIGARQTRAVSVNIT